MLPCFIKKKKIHSLRTRAGGKGGLFGQDLQPSSRSPFSSQAPLFSGSKLEREVKGLDKLCLDFPTRPPVENFSQLER